MIQFFYSSFGRLSSTRLLGALMIGFSLLFVQEILIYGFLNADPKDILTVAGAASTLFVSVAGSAMAFIFKQKQTEVNTPVKDNPVK